MKDESQVIDALLESIKKERDPDEMDVLFSRYSDRLLRMFRLRLDRRLNGRVDESDLLQEVYAEAYRRLPEYIDKRQVPFFIWLRGLAGQKLFDIHRHHLGSKGRDPRREVRLVRPKMPEATSAVIARELIGSTSTPVKK